MHFNIIIFLERLLWLIPANNQNHDSRLLTPYPCTLNRGYNLKGKEKPVE